MKGQVKVELGGKERGLQFGLGALTVYCKKMGTDVDGLDLLLTPGPRRLEAINTLLYAAMCFYSNLNDEDIDFNMAQVELWLEQAPQETAEKIINAFAETIPWPAVENEKPALS